MNAAAETEQSETLISIEQAARDMRVKDCRTVLAACERFGIPVVEISPAVRRLTAYNYSRLIAKATTLRRSPKPAPAPTAGVELVTVGEAALLDCLRQLRPAIRDRIALHFGEFAVVGDLMPPDLCNAFVSMLREPYREEDKGDE